MPYNTGYYYGGDPSNNPLENSSKAPGKLTDYYRDQEKDRPARRQVDPYMEQWKADANANQMRDREELQKLYSQLQAQAAGGTTPQQQQMQRAFQTAAQNQQTLAAGMSGGAYGQAAGRAALTQNAGVQGAQNNQMFGQQVAADRISATRQMQGVAAQQRAMDLQAQGMTAEDAMRQAQLEAQARGMNIDYGLGMAGLEGEGIGTNWDAFMQMRGREAAQRQNEEERKQKMVASGMQASSAAFGAAISDKRAKQEAFAQGAKFGAGKTLLSENPDFEQVSTDTNHGGAPIYRNKQTGEMMVVNPGQWTGGPQSPAAGSTAGDWVDNEGIRHMGRGYGDAVSLYGPRTTNTDLSPAQRQSLHKDMLARLGSTGAKSLAQGFSVPMGGGEAGTSAIPNVTTKDLHAFARQNVFGSPPSVPTPTQTSEPSAISGNYSATHRDVDSALNADNMQSALTQAHIDASPSMAAYKTTAPGLGGAGIPTENLEIMNALVAKANNPSILSDDRAKQEAYTQGKLEGAQTVFDKLQTARGRSDQLFNQGKELETLGRPDLAARAYDKSVSLDPNANAAFNAASAYEDAALPKQANEAALRVLRSKGLHAGTSGPLTKEDRKYLNDLAFSSARNEAEPSPNAMAPKDARAASDALLGKLSASQSQYTYKGEPQGAAPRLGVMAQDLEQAPTGNSLVRVDPRTGLKYIDGPAGLSAAFASLGRINERLKKVERP